MQFWEIFGTGGPVRVSGADRNSKGVLEDQ